MIAAYLAAVDPYVVGMSALVLSEAIFLPLMLAGLWGMAKLWRGTGRPIWVAVGTGLAMGLAIQARPSWALFVPAILAAWVVGAGPRFEGRASGGAGRRPGDGGGDGPVVGPECPDLWPVRAHGPLGRGQSL